LIDWALAALSGISCLWKVCCS